VHKNNKKNNVVYTKIGVCFYNSNRTPLINISKNEVTKFSKLSSELDGLPNFYLDRNNFMFHIYNNYIKGYKLYLKASKDYGQIDVYSINYHEVLNQENIQKVKKR